MPLLVFEPVLSGMTDKHSTYKVNRAVPGPPNVYNTAITVCFIYQMCLNAIFMTKSKLKEV